MKRRFEHARRIRCRWGCIALALLLGGCGHYVEREREIGYRGAARLNPFLAAERLLERFHHEVVADQRWPEFALGDAMIVMPAAMLSAEGFVRQAGDWVEDGGHLVCLFDHADAALDDWRGGSDRSAAETTMPTVWVEWLQRHHVRILPSHEAQDSTKPDNQMARVDDVAFEVSQAGTRQFVLEVGSAAEVDGTPQPFVTVPCGQGRLTLVGDARMFRNRWIGEADHAALLRCLATVSREGVIRFVRGSTTSFWNMAWYHAWPVFIGLAGLTAVWLWRWMPRFGPRAEIAASDAQRDYLRHLAAVGSFFWRLDRGAGLLAPLRGEVIERLQRRFATAGGTASEDIFALAESISGVPRDRAQQALADTNPPDPARFTRMTADLQQMLKTL